MSREGGKNAIELSDSTFRSPFEQHAVALREAIKKSIKGIRLRRDMNTDLHVSLADFPWRHVATVLELEHFLRQVFAKDLMDFEQEGQ